MPRSPLRLRPILFLALNEILERGLLPQVFSTFLPASDLTTDQTAALTQAALHFQTKGPS